MLGTNLNVQKLGRAQTIKCLGGPGPWFSARAGLPQTFWHQILLTQSAWHKICARVTPLSARIALGICAGVLTLAQRDFCQKAPCQGAPPWHKYLCRSGAAGSPQTFSAPFRFAQCQNVPVRPVKQMLVLMVRARPKYIHMYLCIIINK